jgi:hypothetical protein
MKTKRLLFIAATLMLLVCTLASQERAPKDADIFEATVVRIEPWGLIKISCGVAIVYRLAEYRVETVYRGHLHKGDQIIAQHLACNGNELDDLGVSNKVIVFAEKLSRPDKRDWATHKIAGGETAAACPDRSTEKCSEVRFAPGGPIVIRYRGLKVARLIYPTTRTMEKATPLQTP